MAHPSLFLFLAVACGLFTSSYFALPLVFAALTIAGLSCLIRFRHFIFLMIIAYVAGGFLGSFPKKLTLPPTCFDHSQLWRIQIAAPVERHVEDNKIFYKTIAELKFQLCENIWQSRQGRVQVFLPAESPLVRGDELIVKLKLKPLSPKRNPSDNNPETWAMLYGLSGRAQSLSPAFILHRGTGLLATLDTYRHRAEHHLEKVLPQTQAALAKALALGDRASLSVQTKEAWANAGMAHILAISGLHMTLLSTVLYFIFYGALFLIPYAAEYFSLRRIAACLTFPNVILFCLWTGSSASAVRATIMSCVCLLAVVFGKVSSAVNALGIAGIVMVLWDKTTLYDPGFLLSFVAVAALLAIPKDHSKNRVLKTLKSLFFVSLAASLATAPLTAYYFGRVSLIAPFINIVAVPLSSVVVTPVLLGYLLWILIVNNTWFDFLIPLLDKSFVWLDLMAVKSAALPLLELAKPSLWQCFLYCVWLALGFRIWQTRKFLRWQQFFAAIIVILFCCSLYARSQHVNDLKIAFAYVGQGDGAILRLPQGGTVVIDAGGAIGLAKWDPGRAVMAPMLRLWGIKTIDLAILSHPHPDHLNGFLYLAENFRIQEFWYNGENADNLTLQKVLKLIQHKGGQIKLAATLPATVWREGVSFEILHPRTFTKPLFNAEGLSYYPTLSTNDNSIAMRVTYGERSVFFAGDLEHEAEAALINNLKPVDILKVGHHGSKTSSTEEFLQVLQPKVAVISCGEDNMFGFPHPTVMNRFKAHGIKVLTTETHGMITAQTDGKTWQFQTMLKAFSTKILQ